MMKSGPNLYLNLYFRMIVVLLLGWLCPALGLPEIWPPDGRLRPNNYVPPPVCSYVQVDSCPDSEVLMIVMTTLMMVNVEEGFMMVKIFPIRIMPIIKKNYYAGRGGGSRRGGDLHYQTCG